MWDSQKNTQLNFDIILNTKEMQFSQTFQGFIKKCDFKFFWKSCSLPISSFDRPDNNTLNIVCGLILLFDKKQYYCFVILCFSFQNAHDMIREHIYCVLFRTELQTHWDLQYNNLKLIFLAVSKI